MVLYPSDRFRVQSVRSGSQIRVWLGIHICIQSWLVPDRNHSPEAAVRRGELARPTMPDCGRGSAPAGAIAAPYRAW
jgi:hypothetical protein